MRPYPQRWRPRGGLSSSAAFCVLIGRIINDLYNGGELCRSPFGRSGTYCGKNIHFGKPSGLMDQLVCALGGTVYIDFGNDECRADRL
jgi:galactokinase